MCMPAPVPFQHRKICRKGDRGSFYQGCSATKIRRIFRLGHFELMRLKIGWLPDTYSRTQVLEEISSCFTQIWWARMASALLPHLFHGKKTSTALICPHRTEGLQICGTTCPRSGPHWPRETNLADILAMKKGSPQCSPEARCVCNWGSVQPKITGPQPLPTTENKDTTRAKEAGIQTCSKGSRCSNDHERRQFQSQNNLYCEYVCSPSFSASKSPYFVSGDISFSVFLVEVYWCNMQRPPDVCCSGLAAIFMFSQERPYILPVFQLLWRTTFLERGRLPETCRVRWLNPEFPRQQLFSCMSVSLQMWKRR